MKEKIQVTSSPTTEQENANPCPRLGRKTKVASFVRNPGGEEIQVHLTGERVSVATWRADGTMSDNEFVCAHSHLPKLIESLQAAHARGMPRKKLN